MKKREILLQIGAVVIGAILGLYLITVIVGEPETSEAKSVEIVRTEIQEPEKPKEEITREVIDKDELELLAHLLAGECGSDWCSDKMVYYVGSVALNRVESEYFPDTLEEVIYQPGQYACTWDGNIDKEPTDRLYRIAEDLLLNGSILPDDVIYQTEFITGSGVYEQVQNMYFCYL